MSEDKCLLVITVPPSLEDTLADWLIGREQTVGFSSTSVYGHGEGHEGYTLAEQVRGSRRNIQFQIQTTRLHAREILSDMHRDFRNAELRYWIMPMLDGGRLSDRFTPDDAPGTCPASENAARDKDTPGGEAHHRQQSETLPEQTRNGGGTGTGDDNGPDDGGSNGAGGGRSR